MSGNLLEELGWAPGDRCYAQYSEDNLWYPAIIMKEEKGGYVVSFEGYDEEQLKTEDEIEATDLFEEDVASHYDKTKHLFEPPKKDKNIETKKNKNISKKVDIKVKNKIERRLIPRMPPAELIPPPPPGADDELCELLMSWYIAGYQSGRFMAKNAVEY